MQPKAACLAAVALKVASTPAQIDPLPVHSTPRLLPVVMTDPYSTYFYIATTKEIRHCKCLWLPGWVWLDTTVRGYVS